MAKEVNDKENEVKKESTKKESSKKTVAKKETVKKDSTKKASKKDAAKKEIKKSFFKEFKAELKRVSWPTPKQLVNNTIAVISIVLIVCAIVFVLDVIFESLNTYGVEKLKAIVTSSSSETVEEDHEGHDHELVEGENEVVSNEAETAEDAQAEVTNTTEATNTVEETTTEQ